MMKIKGRGQPGDLNGFLDAGSHLKGELHFEDTFRIDGKFEGTVRSDGDLILGAGGEFDGDLDVGRVFVSGTLRGQVRTRRLIEITAQGRVFADLETPALVVEDGGIFEGQCSMQRPNEDSRDGAGSKENKDGKDRPPAGPTAVPLRRV